MSVTDKQWQQARTALAEAGERFAGLLDTAVRPGAPATKGWSIAETAAHVVGIASSYTVLITPDRRASAGYDFLDLVPDVSIESVKDLNETALRHFTERDPAELARQIRVAVAAILAGSAELDPDTPIDWLGGSQVPLAGILAHLVNELLIHGWDIARANGTPWQIPSWQAALFLELFLVGMLRTNPGRLLDPTGAPPGRIAVEFHSRYTTPVTLVLHAGRLTAEPPGSNPDAHVSFDPAALNLMMFHRLGRLRAVLSGQVRIWGRRPWQLPTFLRVVHMP